MGSGLEFWVRERSGILILDGPICLHRAKMMENNKGVNDSF